MWVQRPFNILTENMGHSRCWVGAGKKLDEFMWMCNSSPEKRIKFKVKRRGRHLATGSFFPF